MLKWPMNSWRNKEWKTRQDFWNLKKCTSGKRKTATLVRWSEREWATLKMTIWKHWIRKMIMSLSSHLLRGKSQMENHLQRKALNLQLSWKDLMHTQNMTIFKEKRERLSLALQQNNYNKFQRKKCLQEGKFMKLNLKSMFQINLWKKILRKSSKACKKKTSILIPEVLIPHRKINLIFKHRKKRKFINTQKINSCLQIMKKSWLKTKKKKIKLSRKISSKTLE